MIAKNIINNCNYSIFFPVIDPFLGLELFELKNLYIIKNPKNKHQNSAGLLSHPKTISYIKKISKQNNTKVAIMPFKSSSKIEFICRQNNWKLISNPRKLNIYLEDKINFAKLTKIYKISTIPFYIDRLTYKNIEKYKQKFQNDKLVVQTKTGWAGKSTFLISDSKKLPLPQNTLTKITPYLDGQTITLNACIYQNKLILSPPAVQLNNPKHSSNIFSTTGRTWPTNFDKKITKQIKKIANKTNRLLKKIHYQGFFGLDLFIDNKNRVYLLEINPRLTASFNFYTRLELKNNFTPLLFLHIGQFLNLKLNINLKKELGRFDSKQISGTQIALRNSRGKIFKQIIKNV